MTETLAVRAPVYTNRLDCRLCGGKYLAPVVSLGDQYLVNFVRERDMNLPRAPLDLVQCEGCGLLQLGHSVDPDLLWREFWYRSSVNQTMRDALQDVVDTGLKYHDQGIWLDIGANDGFLLSRVPKEFERIACEPARNFRDELSRHSDAALLDYFDGAKILALTQGKQCSVITSVAVFYDVDDPNTFVAGIANCLSPGGIWINQLNDAPGMLKANAFDAICHEHRVYYDIPNLNRLFQAHGLVITAMSFNEVNGGSVRMVIQKRSQGVEVIGSPISRQHVEDFARRVKSWKSVMQELMTTLWRQGRDFWAYGASTKGCALLQYLGTPSMECITAVADRNPLKHGLLMVGSWTPIKSEEEFRRALPDYALVLPWSFKREFVQRETHTLAAGTKLLFPLPNPEFVL